MRYNRARMQQKKLWQIKPINEEAKDLSKDLKVSPLLANILINRNIENKQDGLYFLNPRLTELKDPTLMPGVSDAIPRVQQAISNKEKITIYGDYDVDGITSTTILLRLFKLYDCDVDFYIPHRVDEGYGLKTEAIKQIAENGTKLLITVDCGITCPEEVEFAKSLGVDVIITDHHQPAETLPLAVAIVHPSPYEPTEKTPCAGAMVAFKLAWAIANSYKTSEKVDQTTREFLIDATIFAAMGTVADVIELKGENRVICKFGLEQLGLSELPGIKALIDAAGITETKINSQHIGFGLAPMLNAAGRMGHARLAVELLTSDNEIRSIRIAEYLKKQNTQRRKHEQDIFKNACELVTALGFDHPDRKTLVLASDSWHRGVIGIVSSRLVDKYHRPTILINTANGKGCGSGRSIEGFNILGGITACSEHLVQFGGHDMAAGITIDTEKINDFAEAFEQYAQENLNEQKTQAKLNIDALCSIDDFNHHVIRELELLSPFGYGNPKPIFASKGVRTIAKPRKVGAKGNHLQLSIADNSGSIKCVGFNMSGLEKKIIESDFFHIAYEPKINNFNGNSNIEFILTDIQFD